MAKAKRRTVKSKQNTTTVDNQRDGALLALRCALQYTTAKADEYKILANAYHRNPSYKGAIAAAENIAMWLSLEIKHLEATND